MVNAAGGNVVARRVGSLVIPLAFGLLGACGGSERSAQSPSDACAQTSPLPVGRWSGHWSSHALARPDTVLEGTTNLVVAATGRLTGSTVDEVSDAHGSVEGEVRKGGEFSAKYSVHYHDGPKDYRLEGTFVCERGELKGQARIEFGEGEQGRMEFGLERSP